MELVNSCDVICEFHKFIRFKKAAPVSRGGVEQERGSVQKNHRQLDGAVSPSDFALFCADEKGGHWKVFDLVPPFRFW
jgi:hypothetical protein